MWSYYGTKKRIAKYYPYPVYDTIIEPFCGAAQYSLYGLNWKRNVILVDKYKVVTSIWNYLINASEKDILSLPSMHKNDSIDSHTQLCDEEKWLIGFCINSGSSMPKKTTKKYNSWNKTKQYIAANLFKIRHWTVINGTYECLANIDATWYIDPPYQFGGEYYRHSNVNIDFAALGLWAMSRNGQIIVCENTKADWLDFRPLIVMNGQLHKTVEAIYHRVDINPYESIFEF